jgi:hypothetical protein
MKLARCVGRVGGLAIALGTGAWLASVPWLAAADPGLSGLDLTSLSGLGLTDLLGPGPVEPALNIDISYNGMDVFHMGDATANSGTGDLAIAYGDGATADAGYGSTSSGLSLVGQHDSAFADGSGSTAIASATGAGSTADALGQSFNTATASDGGTADSGFFAEPGHLFNGGIGDFASASGDGSTAAAGFGNSDLADVSGVDSTALAGGFNSITETAGSSDIAEAFGNDLTANASTGSNLFDFEPSVFTAAAYGAAAAAPPDDYGLSALGLESLVPGLDSLLGLF